MLRYLQKDPKDFSALLRERDEVMPFADPNNNKGKLRFQCSLAGEGRGNAFC